VSDAIPAGRPSLPLRELKPIENRTEVRCLFWKWLAALAADRRFASMKAKTPETAEEVEAAIGAEESKGGFEWRTTLRPAGLPAGLDLGIRLIEKSASFTPLDRNNQAAFGRDPSDGSTYLLRQWYDTRRIGSRPLNAEALARFDAPPSAALFHAASHADAGRGRLYLIVAGMDRPAAEIAQQTYDALAGFHRVAATARKEII
jgi:hypothetical protein